MSVPSWIEGLRRKEVVDLVHDDPRTFGDALLGIDRNRVFNEVIGGGQADFDAPFDALTGADRALLYAYFNQKGHIEELTAAFKMLFKRDTSIKDPVVIDLGAGPCTAGLALAGVLGPDAPFTYIGIDRATSMRALGETLAVAAGMHMECVTRQWHDSVESVVWTKPLGWRPVLVIVSYLLASPTVNAVDLVRDVDRLLARIGRGPTTALYTNSPSPHPNRSFPAFQNALTKAGFDLVADDQGSIRISRFGGSKTRTLRYALFHRQAQGVLRLRGG